MHLRVIGCCCFVVGLLSACVGNAAPPTATGSSAEMIVTPLSEYLGYDAVAAGNDEISANEQVASCMARNGFVWEAPQRASMNPDPNGSASGSRSWVELYGFGVSTLLVDQELLGGGATGFATNRDAEALEAEDPNAKYVESLTVAGRQAYWLALIGTAEEQEDSVAEAQTHGARYVEERAAVGGCFGAAFASVLEAARLRGLFAQEFEAEVSELAERVQGSSLYVELERSVWACVREEGYEFGSKNDADSYFADVAGPLLERSVQEQQGMSDVSTLSKELVRDLAAVQALEVETALVAYDCGGSQQAYRQVEIDVRNELEADFLETHSDRLEPLRLTPSADG